MSDLNRDFLGKFAQPGIDICEPEEGFDKCPNELKHCVDELINNQLEANERIKQLEVALRKIANEPIGLITDKEIAQKALGGKDG